MLSSTGFQRSSGLPLFRLNCSFPGAEGGLLTIFGAAPTPAAPQEDVTLKKILDIKSASDAKNMQEFMTAMKTSMDRVISSIETGNSLSTQQVRELKKKKGSKQGSGKPHR